MDSGASEKPIDPRYKALTDDRAQIVAEGEKTLEGGLNASGLRNADLTPEQQAALAKMEEIVTEVGFTALRKEIEDPRITSLRQEARRIISLDSLLQTPDANIRGFIEKHYGGIADLEIKGIFDRTPDDLTHIPSETRAIQHQLHTGVFHGLTMPSEVPYAMATQLERNNWSPQEIARALKTRIITDLALASPEKAIDAMVVLANSTGADRQKTLESYLPAICEARNLQPDQSLQYGKPGYVQPQDRVSWFDNAMQGRGFIWMTLPETPQGTYVNLAAPVAAPAATPAPK